MIQCVRASDELPYDKTGQIVKCNLWDGFVCNNTDNPPLCYDYKVRIGCLKMTPECSKLLLAFHLKNIPLKYTFNFSVVKIENLTFFFLIFAYIGRLWEHIRGGSNNEAVLMTTIISVSYFLMYLLYVFPSVPSTTPTPQAQHQTTAPVTGYRNTLPCFEGMDMSACPKTGCATGFYCNGIQCVRKNECPCMVDGKVVQVLSLNLLL